MSFDQISSRTLAEIIADPGTRPTEEVAEHESGVTVGVTARHECQVPSREYGVMNVVTGPRVRARYYTHEGMIASAIIELPETVAEGVEVAVRMVLTEVRERASDYELIGIDEAAAIFGVKPATFRRYVSKSECGAPKPDQQFGRTPRWRRATIVEAAEIRSHPRHHLV